PSPSPSPSSVSDPFAADRRNEARVRSNRRRASVLVGTSAAVPAIVLGVVLGLAVGIVVGTVAAVVVFAVVAAVVVREALRISLALVGGRPASDAELPALANQVDGLSATVGVRRPRLWVVDAAVPNACALSGRRDARSVLVVTTGLLGLLGIIELEGVIAHELVHMKREDAAVSAVAVATAGLAAAAFAGDGLVHRALGHGREYEADQAAVLAVRYPPGLHDALVAFGTEPRHARSEPTREGSPFRGRRWAATRWIWIDPMAGLAGVERSPAGELDATDVRAEALAQW
ncbi:MAG: M48 family metalloprotease, partial [Acidimicrobiales bacterium]